MTPIGQRRLLKAKNRQGRAQTVNIQARELEAKIALAIRKQDIDVKMAMMNQARTPKYEHYWPLHGSK